MIKIGQTNALKILRRVQIGIYLDGGLDPEGHALEILLPIRYVPRHADIGETLEVFVAFDSEDRLIATTEKPLAQVGDFAALEIVSIDAIGAFLNWGLSKDLFLPYAEQTRAIRAGQQVVVHIYLDNTNRIAASMRLDRYVDKIKNEYSVGQDVSLFVAAKTDLGFKAIINNQNWGMLYTNEIFQELEHGQILPGVVKFVREDGKIDLSLQKLGHKAAAGIGEQILTELKKQNGYLPVNDKTSAELIYNLFGVSKKKYKMALGGLYKQRLILVEDDGIRLVK